MIGGSEDENLLQVGSEVAPRPKVTPEINIARNASLFRTRSP